MRMRDEVGSVQWIAVKARMKLKHMNPETREATPVTVPVSVSLPNPLSHIAIHYPLIIKTST